MSQITAGLMHCHQNNVVHRDLKLENILFGFHVSDLFGLIVYQIIYFFHFLCKNKLKIADFGTSIHLMSQISESQPKIESIVELKGTPQYMSPEIVEARAHDYRTDIWSLGCILFELLNVAHLTPFEGTAETEEMAKLDIYRRISAVDYKFSEDFDNLEAKDLIVRFLF